MAGALVFHDVANTFLISLLDFHSLQLFHEFFFFNILNVERQKVYLVEFYVLKFLSDFNKILALYVIYMASRKRLLPPRTTAVMKSGLLSLKHILT